MNDEIEKAVKAERDRCVAIIEAARAGLVDNDLRCIRAWIQDGDEPPKE